MDHSVKQAVEFLFKGLMERVAMNGGVGIGQKARLSSKRREMRGYSD
jgi:hypothetical protein